MLKKIPDPRHQSYITYPSAVLLMTRILSSIFYISSMRKTSEEFNSDIIIENIWELCAEEGTACELPYWETINRYLEKLDPEYLQEVIWKLVYRLLRSKAFQGARIRNKHWQIILDGIQIHSSRKPLDPKCLYRIHHKGKPEEYRENYYYVLEAKLVLHPKIVVSIMTEFVENDGKEMDKQDCERKACARLMEKLKRQFPRLGICLCADSLYACEPFFRKCGEYRWHYLIRFKEGSIPTVGNEYRKLKELERNRKETKIKNGRYWHDYVSDIDYNGYKINLVEYGEEVKKTIRRGMGKTEQEEKKSFWFLTSLPVGKKNVSDLVERGRMRWKIENEGFNTQKNQGYYLEHLFSKDYQGIKNHYYLIQIGHMISQILEAWEKLWEGIRLSIGQKHQKLLESFKIVRLKEYRGIEKNIQIRLQ